MEGVEPNTQLIIDLIAHFGFTPLPVEGTLFSSTYKSAAHTAAGGPVATAIIGMYCNEPLSRSLFHRLQADEVWHFYGGDPIRLVLLTPEFAQEIILGADVLNGQHPQVVIPAGTWQAGELVPGGRYGLFGCTMAPGFTGDGFEGGTIGQLLTEYPESDFPEFANHIRQLGVPDGHNARLPDGYQDPATS